MDRLRRMELLVRAAEAGSFARAAQLLQVDPSTVSHAIAELEKELRLSLFYRTTRQLQLTEDGEEIFRRSREVLAQVAELDAVASRTQERLSGILRIGMSVAIGRHIIIPRIPAFMRRHPHLRLECFVLTQVKEMHAGGLDVMLRAGAVPDSSLIARKILDIRFGVYGAPGYLVSAGEPTSPEALVRHRCFVHKPPVEQKALDEWVFERAGERSVVKVPRSLVTDDREGMIDAVLAGGGLMRIGMFDPTLIASGRLRKVLGDWNCIGGQPVHALYRRSSRASPKVAAFLQFVVETIAAFDPEQVTLTHGATFDDGIRRAGC
ncbi:MAG: LysR family transcriptional regulator [Betaproteobacteria bacterium]|nr:LysR family transcriptional regulator [Betaproteobacteria bacterium]MBI2291745.1 LysR family transcriptional regulator [Betaproteobacteria bacterium]MBI3054246.1 LysR family transcriptional regulator [Betaproteobacteria bacterium]